VERETIPFEECTPFLRPAARRKWLDISMAFQADGWIVVGTTSPVITIAAIVAGGICPPNEAI
jgi:hypothetical protein